MLTYDSNYEVTTGFPRLPNYPNDASASAAAGTPQVGMMFYDTSVSKAKVYAAGAWQVMN